MKTVSQKEGLLSPSIITHKVKQNTKEWLELRLKHRCASETATLVKSGLLNTEAPMETLVKVGSRNEGLQKIVNKLTRHITGVVHDKQNHFSNVPAMAHGTRCESSAANIFVKKCLPKTLQVLKFDSEVVTYKEYLASIDLSILTTDASCPKIYVEIKCPYTPDTSPYVVESFDDLSISVKSQMQHQLYVTGMQSMVFFVAIFNRDSNHYKELLNNPDYLIPEAEYRHFVVQRDNKFIEDICNMWDRLYQYCLSTVDGKVTETNNPIIELESQYLECVDRIDEYSVKKAELRERIVSLIDDKVGMLCGEKIFVKKRIVGRKTLNRKKVEELLTPQELESCTDYIETESYYINKL